MKHKILHNLKRPLLWKSMIVFCIALFSFLMVYMLPPHLFIHHEYSFAEQKMKAIPFAINRASSFFIIISSIYWLKWLVTHSYVAINDHVRCYEVRIYMLFFLTCLFMGLGSVFHELIPTHISLFWVYLFSSMAVMGLLSAIIADHIHLRLGLYCCIPFIFLGMVSVFCGKIFPWNGEDDLRWYSLTYYLPPLLMLAIVPLTSKNYNLKPLICAGIFFFASLILGKFNQEIFDLSKGMTSGQHLNQFYLSVAIFSIGQYLKERHAPYKNHKIKIKRIVPTYPSPSTLIPNPAFVIKR